MGKLGILAGAGELPHIGMKEALAAGEDPILFSIIESDFHVGIYGDRNIPIHIVKIGTLLKLCKRHNVDRLLLLGKVKKEIIFKNLKFDLKAIALLARMINRHDYSIFKTVADEFAKEKSRSFLKKLFFNPYFFRKVGLLKNL